MVDAGQMNLYNDMPSGAFRLFDDSLIAFRFDHRRLFA